MRALVGHMLLEEYRHHVSYSSGHIFMTFPVMVCAFSFFGAVSLPSLSEEMPFTRIVQMTHISLLLYGLSVGSFAFMGREVQERQFGRKEFLASQPAILPFTYKKAVLAMYFRDLIFYMLLIIVPGVSGIALSVPFTHFRLSSVAIFLLAAVLTFLFGLSLSFFFSALYVGWPRVFWTGLAGVVAALLGAYPLAFYDGLELLFGMRFQETGNIRYLALSCALVMGLTATGYVSVRERMEAKRPRKDVARGGWFARFGQPVFAKEWTDVMRSRTLGKMFFSFVVPLLFLSATSVFVRYGLDLPVGFNTVFYGGMVGFFGVLIYSWLNSMDAADYYQTLPVSVSQVIRMRLRVFFWITIGISTVFVVGIGVINDELNILPLALAVMLATSIYMVTMTAYLTGLRPNSFLFDPAVLLKFTVLSLLPDVCITILSFSIYSNMVFAIAGLALVCASMAGATAILYKGIEVKWEKAEFTL